MINCLDKTISHSSFFSSNGKKKKCNTLNFIPKFLYDESLFKTKEKQRFLITFYRGYAKSSYKKLGESYGTSKYVAQNYINQWLKLGFIEKTNNLYKPDLYIKSKGRHCLVQGENYYRLTKKGKDYRKEILNSAVQKCREINSQSEIQFLNEVNSVNQIIENAFKNLVSSILNYPHYRSEEKSQEGELRPSSPFALERKVLMVGAVSQESCATLTEIFRACLAKTKSKPLKSRKISETSHIAKSSFKNTEKFRAIQKKFHQFGFKKLLGDAYRGTLLKLMTLSIEFIEKLLKLVRSKLKHKWKLRSFWGFFLSEVKKLPEKRRFAKSFFKMRAQECRDAVNGENNRFSEGVDTSVIIQGIAKMERETGEKISENTLERMLYHGTQRVKTAVDTVRYRLSLGKGELPQEKVMQEDTSQKPNKRPIFKMIKVNAQTKEPYSNEDFLSGASFAMVNKIVGYEPVKEQAKQKQNPQEKRHQKQKTKIRSWIGMVFFALNIGDPCAIQKAFFEKREATG